MQNFKVNSMKFDWRFKSKWKWKKTTFEEENLQNFTIWEEKIRSIPIQITRENEEFNNEFKQIRLKIQIEEKMEE